MSDDGEPMVIKSNEVGAVESDILRPGQAIESSRKLDNLLTDGIKEARRGTIPGKVDDLISDMADFNAETHLVLDGVRDKMQEARRKREEAAEVQHAYLDGSIGDFQKTIDAIDRLSNSPFVKGGKT